VVTGHKYRLHWGQATIDYDSMDLYMPPETWNENDKNVHIMNNFTDTRHSINITSKFTGELVANETYTQHSEDELISGDNVIYN